jgi:hypothetical protein
VLEDYNMVLLHPGEDLFQREVLVVRNVEVLDLIALDESFRAAGHVAEVPRGHCILRRAVGLDVLGEEVVRLLLGLELGGELCHRHSDSLSLWIVTFHLDRFKNLINNDKD